MAKSINIYIDIDGVLTTKFSNSSKQHSGLQFDSVCVENLKQLITDLRNIFEIIVIIIISDWRYNFSRNELEYIFCTVYKLKGYIDRLDVTEKMYNREFEIKQHMESQNDSDIIVILDDMNLKDDNLTKYHLRTREEDGIRAFDDVKSCILRIIQKQIGL
ncbi:HAD domain-containing protein [Virgibacillus oceani]|uniref:Uncharacterized protein n=1 Tax=Virgibacillus oceani TaxID=1479511 RepID=A0A917GXX1_9BACI|nr:HAD domain-containing protein [Virgibacillus oceani]GGG61084.1 hypothetical protein GCM10011398_00430 [Virgibacillus oceani]